MSEAAMARRRPRPASHALEQELVVSAKAPDQAARADLVEAFLPLIGSVARLYGSSPTITRDELMQEGVVGLLRALRRYDPELGTPFWAYASWWVRQAMQRLVSELGLPLVLSDRALRELARLKAIERNAGPQEGRRPTVDQLATRAGMRPDHVAELMAAQRTPRRLEEPVSSASDSGTVGDRLADETAEDAYDRVERLLDARMLLELVATELDERERVVVRGRYGFDGDEQTLRVIGDALGVSAERVRQIEREALDKLRRAQDSALLH